MEIKPIYSNKYGTLYNDDCLKVLPQLPSQSVDCIFADPPFNIGKKYGAKVNDNQSDKDYLAWSFKWIEQCVRLLKPGGSLFIYNLPKWNMLIAPYLYEKLFFRHWIGIDFKAALPIPGKLYPAHYSLLYFTNGKPKTFNRPKIPVALCRKCGNSIKDYGGYKKYMNNGINLSDVWSDIHPVRHKKYKNWGNNELPEAMLKRVIDMSTEEHDLILDPFGGSGTTYAVAEKLHRSWIGCEIGDCSSIIRRISKNTPITYENYQSSTYSPNFNSSF